VKVLKVPEPPGVTPTYFLVLQLDDASGRTVSRNVYWLSTKGRRPRVGQVGVVLHPAVAVRRPHGPAAAPAGRGEGDGRFATGRASVTLENPSRRSPSSSTWPSGRARARGGAARPLGGQLPHAPAGETRDLTATYAAKDLGSATPVVSVDGWNIADSTAQ